MRRARREYGQNDDTASAESRKKEEVEACAVWPPWSAHVTRTSNALDLERNVFKRRTAGAIASSLKRSAERSRRRKGTSYQSAMSMLNFYINRAGRNLPIARRRKLEGAKPELRRLYGRP
jgi:hypothetical protein